MEYFVFYSFAAIAVAAAVLMVLQKKTVYSALSLVVCFGAMAVLFFQLGAPFIAAVQVIVYAGAIMVLFVFVIMLIDPESETFSVGRTRRLPWLGVPLAAVFLFLVARVFPYFRAFRGDSLSEREGTIEAIGRMLFSEYVLPFEATSILILVAVLGAIVLTKRTE